MSLIKIDLILLIKILLNMLTESKKLVLSILFLLFVFYLAGISNAYAHNHALDNRNDYPLQDLGFRLTKNMNSKPYYAMNDYLLYVIAGIALTWTIIFSNKKVIIFKRWVLMVSFLFLLRVITVPSTILTRPFENPDDWVSCKTLEYRFKNLLLAPLNTVIEGKLGCFDFFYSGHTINMIVPTLIIQKYFPNNRRWLKYFMVSLMWLLSFTCMFFIILLRSHYTIDVQAALFFTVLLWKVMDYQIKYKTGLLSYCETIKEPRIIQIDDIENQI